jgi:hypothetical protein
MLVTTSAAAVMLGALVLVRYASAPPSDDLIGDESADRLEQSAEVTPSPEPVPAVPAPEMKVASAGIVATPAVEEPPAAPVVMPKPRKIVPAVVKPAKSRVAADMKTVAKPATKAVEPKVQAPVVTMPAKTEVAATHIRAASVVAEHAGPPPVTLTGCLEISADRDAFRLTDTDGIDAPKARSWRTGFLTKRATPVALIDAPDPRGLQRQVGKRVSATGMLVDRELKVSSVSVVGASCE